MSTQQLAYLLISYVDPQAHPGRWAALDSRYMSLPSKFVSVTMHPR